MNFHGTSLVIDFMGCYFNSQYTKIQNVDERPWYVTKQSISFEGHACHGNIMKRPKVHWDPMNAHVRTFMGCHGTMTRYERFHAVFHDV